MNASRSRREVTSETSIFDTNNRYTVIPNIAKNLGPFLERVAAEINQRCFTSLNMTTDGSGQAAPFLGNFLHGLSHGFLAENQIYEQQIKGNEFEPEKVNRLAYEQDCK